MIDELEDSSCDGALDDEPPLYPKYLNRFKFLFILYDIVEITPLLDPKKNYYLKYKILGETVKIKLPAGKTLRAGIPLIPINKLRLYYFFSNHR